MEAKLLNSIEKKHQSFFSWSNTRLQTNNERTNFFSLFLFFSFVSLSLSRFRSLFSPSHWLFNTFLPFVSCRLYWCKKAVVLSIDFSIQKHREHGRWAYSWTFFRMYRINFARSFLIIHPLKKNNSTYKRILLFLASRRSPFPWWRWWWWQS